MMGERSRAAGLVVVALPPRCSFVGSKKVPCGLSRGGGAYEVGIEPIGGGDLCPRDMAGDDIMCERYGG